MPIIAKMSANNSQNIVQRLVPRKKFTLNAEINAALRRFKNQTSGEWKSIPNKALIARISSDFYNCVLPVCGTRFQPINCTMAELLDHFQVLGPPEENDNIKGAKLKSTPLFYVKSCQLHMNGKASIGRSLPPTLGFHDLMGLYVREEFRHKSVEDHHPGTEGWDRNHSGLKPWKGVEAVFDVFNSLLRIYSVKSSWEKLFKILLQEPYSTIQPTFVYMALLHIRIRGVAGSAMFKHTSRWRYGNSLVNLEKLHKEFLNRIPPPSFIAAYQNETKYHQLTMDLEMKRLRVGCIHHDYTKFDNHSVYAYAWRWGVWEQMPFAMRNRAMADMTDLVPPSETVFEPEPARFTMKSLMKNVGSEVAGEISSKMQESLNDSKESLRDLLSEASDMLDNKISRASSVFGEKFQEQTDRLVGEAKKLTQEFFSSANSFTQDTASLFSEKAKEVLGNMPDTMEELTVVLKSMESLIQTQIANYVSRFNSAFKTNVFLSASNILSALRYFILMQNVDNKFLKMLLFLGILNSFGALHYIGKWIFKIHEYLTGATTEEEPAMPTSNESGEGFISWIFGSVKNLMKVFFGLVASVFSGRLLSKLEFNSMLASCSGVMKHFHFIGGGLLGITRIFEFSQKAFKKISEWTKEHIFGYVPETRIIGKRVLSWVLKVRYFITEAGMNAIRISKKAKDIAAKLFSEGQQLLTLVSSTSKFYSRELLMDIQRHWNDVKIISNYVTRINSMSQFQPTMFHIQLVGQAGIGKSTLVKDLVRSMLRTQWGKDQENSFWSYNPNLEYFDGYAGQLGMIIDDMFRYNEPKHLTSLIGLVTNTPVILPMANLEDKGCQLTSEFLVSTTNTAYPIGKDILCMDAVYRRRHMLVQVTMDDKVRNQATGAFDGTLYNKFYPADKYDKTTYPHLRFHLLRPVPDRVDELEYLEENCDESVALKNYVMTLQNANKKIMLTSERSAEPCTLFTEREPPPSPIKYPCKDWTYDELLKNMAARFLQFRGLEGTYTPKMKFEHIEECFSEIDHIMNQNADIPDNWGDFDYKNLEFTKLIDKQFFDAQHPFGSDDPIGERIYQNLGTEEQISPELENLDIDSIVSSVVEEETSSSFDVIFDENDSDKSKPHIVNMSRGDSPGTSGMTPASEIGEFTMNSEERIPTFEEIENQRLLREDDIRRNRILRNKKKTIRDPYLIHAPKMIEVPSGEKGIPLDPSMTVFSGPWSHRLKSGWLANIAEVSRYLKELSPRMVEFEQQFSYNEWNVDFCNNIFPQFVKMHVRMAMSSNIIIPKHEAFPKERWGKSVQIPIEFLQCMEFKELGEHAGPVFVPPVLLMKEKVPIVKVKVDQAMDKTYEVPLDDAFLWSQFGSFMIWMMEFDQFTPTQQRILQQDAIWRNKYTGFYTLESIRLSCKSVLAQKTIAALEIFTSPIYRIFNARPAELTCLLYLICGVAIVYILYSLVKLLLPKKSSTSKYLHRGPESGVRYMGKFTSELLGNDCMEVAISTLMRRNVRQVIMTDKNGVRIQIQALFSQRYFIFNRHALLPLSGDLIQIELCMPNRPEEQNWKFNLLMSNVYSDLDGDLAIAHCPTTPMARSVREMFVTEEEYSRMEIPHELVFLSCNNTEIGIEHHKALRKLKKIGLSTSNHGVVYMDHAVYAQGHTMVGKSGSPVCLPNPKFGQFKLLGIQAWQVGTYFDSKIAIQVVTKEKYDYLTSKLIEKMQFTPIERLDDYEDHIVEESELGAFTSSEYNNVICLAPKEESAGLVGKTQFKQTPIADFMTEDGFQSKRVPAVLNPKDRNLYYGTKIHPLNHSLNKFFKDKIEPLNETKLDYIEESLTTYFRNMLDKAIFEKLDYKEIITGSREDGSNPMDLRSSPGIPFIFRKRKFKGKKDFFQINEEGEVDYYDPDFQEEYEDFKKTLESGKLPLTRSYDFPKDELRPVAKAYGDENGPPKTRTVTCMNMMYCMLWRELTLDMWASFHRIADGNFQLCPGINPEGPEWNNAFYYLNKHKYALDFDVSNWDGYLPPQLLFRLGNIICRLNNYDPGTPEWNCIQAILTEVAFGYVQHGRVIYQKFRGVISGFPGTAEVNSMIHLMLIFYIYLDLVKDTPAYASLQAFLDNVSCLIYGDDIILTIAEPLIELVNGFTISNKYISIGYPVTAAEKGAAILKHKPLLACKFLKSTWNKLSGGIMIRKMDLDVAYDLLYWERAKEQPLEQFYDNIVDSLRIVFGHGRKTYQKFLEQLNSWLKKADLPSINFTYNDLFYDHMRKYYVDYY